jgi:pimeloyl-ACP methyl ester carboxylesterase
LLAQAERVAHIPLRLLGFRSRFLKTSAGRIHALTSSGTGAGPPLVLLHGYSAAALHYVPLIRRLRPLVRKIIAVDLPAHGLSDSPRGPLERRQLAAGLIEALDGLLGEPAIVFGNSLGGLAAIHYALARPECIAGLVLCSPAGAAMSEAELVRLRASFAIGSHKEALAFVDKLLPPGSAMRHLFAWGLRQKFNHPVMRAILETLRPADLLRPQELRALPAPTLLLWGTKDVILPAASREFFRRHKPAHARFEEPEGFSHSPYIENAEALTERLAEFVREVQRQRSVTVVDAGADRRPVAV